MNINNPYTHLIIDNNTLLKDYFIAKGVTYLDNASIGDIDKTPNCFYVIDRHPMSTTSKTVHYHTNASVEICLGLLCPHLTEKEIKQIITIFNFHHVLFSIPNDKNNLLEIIVTDEEIFFDGGVLELSFSKKKCRIYQSCAFFEKRYPLKHLTVDNFHKIMIKQLKSSFSKYFDRPIIDIDSTLVNKVLNETVEDYNHRINYKEFFNDWNDHDFFLNIKKTDIAYKVVMIDDYPSRYINTEDELSDTCELVILKHNPVKKKRIKIIDRITAQDPVTITMNIKNIKTIRKLFSPVFKEKELSYLLSIISVFDLIEQMNNPYENTIILNIYKSPTFAFSKQNAYANDVIFNFSCHKFDLGVGKRTELHTNGLIYQNDDFEAIYKKLVEYMTNSIATALDTDVNDLTYKHIKLQQMNNS